MPYSSDEGKDIIRGWVRYMQPRTVLDIGTGAGFYSRIVRAEAPGVAVDGVEIFAPYRNTFSLDARYDNLIIGDARDSKLKLPRGSYDLVIMGDVLEHMTAHEAEDVWCRMLALSTRACILSIPVIEYPQGPVLGNEHEAHISTWDAHKVLKSLPEITEWWIGHQIGVFKAVTENMHAYPLPVGVWE